MQLAFMMDVINTHAIDWFCSSGASDSIIQGINFNNHQPLLKRPKSIGTDPIGTGGSIDGSNSRTDIASVALCKYYLEAIMNHVQLACVLYEYGMPGVKFHYENGETRTLSDEQALKFVSLADSERHRNDIDFMDMNRVRKYVANQYFY